MKTIIAIIAILGLAYMSGTPIVKYLTKTETKKEYMFISLEVRKMHLIYKHIVIPLEKKFGKIYWTSLGRLDPGSQHDLRDTTTVAADWDQDVLIRRGCDTCATNKEIFDYINNNWNYDQLGAGRKTSKPTYGHIGIKLQETNRGEILIKNWRGKYFVVGYKQKQDYLWPLNLLGDCKN